MQDLAQIAQEKFLKEIMTRYGSKESIPPQAQKAFINAPRHLFVRRFRKSNEKIWVEITESNLPQYLPDIYDDSPLVIYGTEDDFKAPEGSRPISTISQPSFVLSLLTRLDLRPGQNILEIGTASGWNAAMISNCVGQQGKVVTLEIIPELAKSAQTRLKEFKYKNVTVIERDAFLGASEHAPFDRIIFTAGALDLPLTLFEQLKIGGIMLYVFKGHPYADLLYRLRKSSDSLVSDWAVPCGFVPMTGKSENHILAEKSRRLLGSDKLGFQSLLFKQLRIVPHGHSPLVASPGEIKLERKDFNFIWS